MGRVEARAAEMVETVVEVEHEAGACWTGEDVTCGAYVTVGAVAGCC